MGNCMCAVCCGGVGPPGPQGPRGIKGPEGSLLPLYYIFRTTDYTVPVIDQLIEFGDGDQLCELLTAVGRRGEGHIIKKSGTGGLVLTADGVETIDGSNSIFMNQWDCYTIVSNGANWIII